MKAILAILLITIATQALSQVVVKQRMDVKSVNFDQTVKCLSDTVVYWGIKQDTLEFHFASQLQRYYPTVNSNWTGRFKRLKTKLVQWIDRHQSATSKYYLVRDSHNEKYLIHFTHSIQSGGYAIFIANIEYGIPSYAMCTQCDLCK